MSDVDDVRTSRTMLAKSQTFCGTKTISNDPVANASAVYRARSDASLNVSQQLSQSHRRKLLWAVSTSLRKKNITTQHANFTAFASVLAKVVKRLFLENRDESVSTSDTMIRYDEMIFCLLRKHQTQQFFDVFAELPIDLCFGCCKGNQWTKFI